MRTATVLGLFVLSLTVPVAQADDVSDAHELLALKIKCPVAPRMLNDFIKEIRVASWMGSPGKDRFAVKIEREQANVSNEGESYPYKDVETLFSKLSDIGSVSQKGTTLTIDCRNGAQCIDQRLVRNPDGEECPPPGDYCHDNAKSDESSILSSTKIRFCDADSAQNAKEALEFLAER